LTRKGRGQVSRTKNASIHWVGPGQVSHLCLGLGKFPLKTSNFSIFILRFKKISSGWVKKYPGHRQFGLLFTAVQIKLGSGPISSDMILFCHMPVCCMPVRHMHQFAICASSPYDGDMHAHILLTLSNLT